MEARNDKISDKRRRLFKALSVAPVVATLRPGSALATASAYQCLTKGHDISDWHEYTWAQINDPCSVDGEACYAYEYRNYIDTREGVPVDGRTCPGLHPIIVEVGGDGSEVYMDWAGADASPFININNNYPHLRNVRNADGLVCVKKIPVRRGLFAVVGHTNDDQTSFVIDGVVPEHHVGGGYQGITGTCMNSIVGVTPKTLSQG